MMKKFLLMLAVALMPVAFFSACNDDTDPWEEPGDKPENLGAAVAGEYVTPFNIQLNTAGDRIDGAKPYAGIVIERQSDERARLTIKGAQLVMQIVGGETETEITNITNLTASNIELSGTKEKVDFEYETEASGNDIQIVAISGKVTVVDGKKSSDLVIVISYNGEQYTIDAKGDEGEIQTRPTVTDPDAELADAIVGIYEVQMTLTLDGDSVELPDPAYITIGKINRTEASLNLEGFNFQNMEIPVNVKNGVELAGTEVDVAVSYSGGVYVPGISDEDIAIEISGNITDGKDMDLVITLNFGMDIHVSAVGTKVPSKPAPPVDDPDYAELFEGEYKLNVQYASSYKRLNGAITPASGMLENTVVTFTRVDENIMSVNFQEQDIFSTVITENNYFAFNGLELEGEGDTAAIDFTGTFTANSTIAGEGDATLKVKFTEDSTPELEFSYYIKDMDGREYKVIMSTDLDAELDVSLE